MCVRPWPPRHGRRRLAFLPGSAGCTLAHATPAPRTHAPAPCPSTSAVPISSLACTVLLCKCRCPCALRCTQDGRLYLLDVSAGGVLQHLLLQETAPLCTVYESDLGVPIADLTCIASPGPGPSPGRIGGPSALRPSGGPGAVRSTSSRAAVAVAAQQAVQAAGGVGQDGDGDGERQGAAVVLGPGLAVFVHPRAPHGLAGEPGCCERA